MQVNKTTVDTAKENKINKNCQSKNETCFIRKNIHNEKKV